MAKNFLSAATLESVKVPGKRKRSSEEFVSFSCRTRSQGPLPSACESISVPRARKRTKLHGSNVCSGVKNYGRTCYIGSALRLALSVSPWKSVRFSWLTLRLAAFYCILYSVKPKFIGTQLRFRILLPSLPHPGIAQRQSMTPWTVPNSSTGMFPTSWFKGSHLKSIRRFRPFALAVRLSEAIMSTSDIMWLLVGWSP